MRIEYRILREIPVIPSGVYKPQDYERVQYREVYGNNQKSDWKNFGKTPEEFDHYRSRASMPLLKLPVVEIDHNK
ncbi:MAG: hypothetical protein GY804_03760 [Alphaproteobacteria bacterium]|nr:hypothetical protein [Alphaproteobacteria bacterium]